MFSEFIPHPLARGGQLQTFIAHVSGQKTVLSNVKSQILDVGDGDRILLQRDIPANGAPESPIVVMLHGLGGCSESSYNLRIAHKLNEAGIEVVRFNHRGCGPNARGLAKQIYHAGRIDDILKTLECLRNESPNRSVLIVGFSLSANALLMMLGLHSQTEPLSQVESALAICPPVDLEMCSQALCKRVNTHMDIYYTKRLVETTNERSRVFEEIEPTSWPKRMSLRKFDEIFTAPVAGFNSLEHYYDECSAKNYLGNISLPTTILAAKDDPIIPIESFAGAGRDGAVRVEITESGGHMGYLCRQKTRYGDYRWLDVAVVDWVLSHK